MITDSYLIHISPSMNGEIVICTIKYCEDGELKQNKLPIASSFFEELGYSYEIDSPLLLSSEEMDNIIYLSQLTSAINKGLDLLYYSQSSEKGLKDKLIRKGFSREISEKAASYIEENGFIDELSQAELFAKDLAEIKLYGKNRIKNELFKKGYKQTVINEVLDTLDVDFVEICKKRITATMKSDSFSSKERASKNVNALIRYGFSFSEIKSALNRL